MQNTRKRKTLLLQWHLTSPPFSAEISVVNLSCWLTFVVTHSMRSFCLCTFPILQRFLALLCDHLRRVCCFVTPHEQSFTRKSTTSTLNISAQVNWTNPAMRVRTSTSWLRHPCHYFESRSSWVLFSPRTLWCPTQIRNRVRVSGLLWDVGLVPASKLSANDVHGFIPTCWHFSKT